MYNKHLSTKKRSLLQGYRSGLEQIVGSQLKRESISYEYEKLKLPYTIPASNHVYTPDFVLANGIVVETKGIWVLEDRKKLRLIKEQYPNLDLRMVFTRSCCKIRKGAKTTYADVCVKYGIPFANRLIPLTWLKEKPKKKSIKIIDKLRSMADEKGR